MLRNKQTRQGKKGNCVEACIANLLEFPVKCFPDFSHIPSDEGQKHFTAINKFLSHDFGCYLEYVRFEKGAFTYPRGIVLAIGSSSVVKGELHCVLWDYDNERCVFDPSPSVGFNGECSLAGQPDAFGILVRRFEYKDEERQKELHTTNSCAAPTVPVGPNGFEGAVPTPQDGRENNTDSPMSSMVKLSEGNPGAASVMARLFVESPQIDPDAAFGGLTQLLALDTHAIYGPRIWMLYKDVCGQNLIKMIAVLRAVQLGLLTESRMNHAIDNYGEGIEVDALLALVRNELPDFGKEAPAKDGEVRNITMWIKRWNKIMREIIGNTSPNSGSDWQDADYLLGGTDYLLGGTAYDPPKLWRKTRRKLKATAPQEEDSRHKIKSATLVKDN